MRLSVLGINHNSAPLVIREQVAVRTGGLPESLSVLRASGMPHSVIVSTCNRTEIYYTDTENHPDGKAGLDFLKARANVTDDSLLPYIYARSNNEVAEHLFRIASGLESLIVGEYEVLGQVKQALEAAEKAEMVNLPLRHLFQSAIKIGRRVRSETGISRNALSVSSVAVDLAAGIVCDLAESKMLVIGTGEAGRLVAKAARERGVSHIIVAGRTEERAAALAEKLGGTPISVKNLGEELPAVNLVITCSGAPHPVLAYSRVEEAMNNRPASPMVIIDIAIPRNVEPRAAQIKGVFLYNIDDLTGISNANRRQREAEIRHAEEIISSEVAKFASWWHALEIRPVISALVNKAEQVRAAQLNKVLSKLPPLSAEQRQSLEAMSSSIIGQILEDPIRYLKTNGNDGHSEIIKHIFQLEITE